MTDRFVRSPECERITGLSRSTLWRLERSGKFPRSRQISPNAKGRLLSEIMEWVRERAEEGAQGEATNPIDAANPPDRAHVAGT